MGIYDFKSFIIDSHADTVEKEKERLSDQLNSLFEGTNVVVYTLEKDPRKPNKVFVKRTVAVDFIYVEVDEFSRITGNIIIMTANGKKIKPHPSKGIMKIEATK